MPFELSISTKIGSTIYKPHDLLPQHCLNKPGSAVYDHVKRITPVDATHYWSLYKHDADGLPHFVSEHTNLTSTLDTYSLLTGIIDPTLVHRDLHHQTLPDSTTEHADHLIVWEWTLENKASNPVLQQQFEIHGTCEMRDRCKTDTDLVITLLQRLSNSSFKHMQIMHLVPYDWELMPSLLEVYYSNRWRSLFELELLFKVALSRLLRTC